MLRSKQILWNSITASYFFAGPESGTATTPTFRSIVYSDISDLIPSTSITLNQIAFGTGIGITSSSSLSYNGSTLNIIGSDNLSSTLSLQVKNLANTSMFQIANNNKFFFATDYSLWDGYSLVDFSGGAGYIKTNSDGIVIRDPVYVSWRIYSAATGGLSSLNIMHDGVGPIALFSDSGFGVGVSSQPLARIHAAGVSSIGINQRLEPISGVTEDTSGATITTTDGTTTTLQTIAIPTNTILMINSYITAIKTAGAGDGVIGNGNGYNKTACYSNISGVVSLSGAVQSSFTGESITSFDTSFLINGTDVLLQVTGTVSDTVNWNSITKTYKVS